MRKLSMNELNRITVDEFKGSEKNKIIVVLDNIRSMHNVGSVFRTCDAFLVEAIFLCGFTAQPPHRDIQKTALGATETVDWIYFTETIEAVKKLKENGYAVFGIEQVENSVMLQKLHWNENDKVAIIFGNEVEGVQSEVLELCDGYIEIPQLGMKHSLNVSVSAGIVLWEFIRKIKSLQ
jgi:23S rRNA (guanosine2251-2'-O)-methyltransferase